MDVLNEVSVHYVALKIKDGMFGGPAFILLNAVVQKGDTTYTIGLFRKPRFSSASNLSQQLLSIFSNTLLFISVVISIDSIKE